MSHALRLGAWVLSSMLGVAAMGCSVAPAIETGETESAATAEATVVFHGNWTTEVRGTLERGRRLRVLYSADRAKCTATAYGNPAWSVLAYYRKDRAEANVLVLNSMAMLPRGVERLQASKVNKLYTYLDHDAAGEKGLATLQAASGWQVLDASGLYAGFKDANAFWA